MVFKEIDGAIYFFTDSKNSIAVDDNAILDFCHLACSIDLKDIINYCSQKKVTKLTQDDIKAYCLEKGIERPAISPITSVGDVEFSPVENGSSASLEQTLELLNVSCLNEFYNISKKLPGYLEMANNLYKNPELLGEDGFGLPSGTYNMLDIVALLGETYTIPEANTDENYANAILEIKGLFSNFNTYKANFDGFDEMLQEIPTTEDIDIQASTDSYNSKISSIGSLSLEEIKQEYEVSQENFENELVEDEPFSDTTFYKAITGKISVIDSIISNIDALNGNSYVLAAHKEKLAVLKNQASALKDAYSYLADGFIEEVNEIKSSCPESLPAQADVPNDLELPNVDSTTFDVLKQSITIEDRAYWVKFAKLLTTISIVSPQFWTAGLITPAGPILLPTIYINLGVISFKVNIDELQVSAPFLIVPFIAITGMCITPYVMLINLSNTSVGAVAGQSATCLFTFRSSMVSLLSGLQSKEVKPFTIPAGDINIDVKPEITALLGLLIRDDFPPYHRLKLSNIPFVAFTLFKMAMAQKTTTGFF